jgi:hypothetical protein
VVRKGASAVSSVMAPCSLVRSRGMSAVRMLDDLVQQVGMLGKPTGYHR